MTNKHHLALGALLVASLASGTVLAGAALDRVRDSGTLRLAYVEKAKPFTSPSSSGGVEGYGASLCERIAAQAKSQLGLAQLNVQWVPVTVENAVSTISGGSADVLCTPASATLERRKSVSFSIPIFAGGIRAVVRTDATTQLRDVLEAKVSERPVWRGAPALTLLEKTRFAAVAGTTSEKWLASKVAGFKLNTATVSVPDYASGLKFLQERKIDVFLAERDVALAAMDDSARKNLLVLKRQMTHEPLALAVPRGDEDLRLLVDTALTRAYNSPEFATLYGDYFGTFDEGSRQFFSWATPAP
jgi:polar amino acid transport system substrate-binding protein